MFAAIKAYCDDLTREFQTIPGDRKERLSEIILYIAKKRKANQPVKLVYICTHNSRRSHYGQIWARVAASYYKVNNINTYSGGTETSAFNINAINSLKNVGFDIRAVSTNKNPTYLVFYDNNEKPIKCFSKIFDDPENPKNAFAAIMTCGEAEKNCPFIPGAELRIATPYDDPKAFDATPLQEAKYNERCHQIALETFYIFSQL